jgi:hypothetical protein
MKREAKVRPADQSIIATQRGDIVLTPTNNPPKLSRPAANLGLTWLLFMTWCWILLWRLLYVAMWLLLLEDTLQHYHLIIMRHLQDTRGVATTRGGYLATLVKAT